MKLIARITLCVFLLVALFSLSSPVYAANSNIKVKLYKISEHPTEYWLVEEEVEIEVTNGAIARAVIEEIIKEENRSKYMIPEGTDLLSLNLKNGLLTIDFSSEFKNTNLGHGYEYLMIYTLVNSLTEFSSIDRVQFWIEGNVVESLSHIYVKEPFERDESIIADLSEQSLTMYNILDHPTDYYLVPEKRNIKIYNKAIAKAIIDDLLKDENRVKNSIPEGTQLLSLNLKNGLLTIDFSSEFKNTNLGHGYEYLMVYSTVNSLTEISNIERIQFLIEGVKDNLPHIDISQPLERDESIIAKVSNKNIKVYGIPENNSEGFIYPYNVDVKVINYAVAKAIIEKMITDENDKNYIPDGTKLLSLNLKNGLLTIDFSIEFKNTGLNYSEEKLMIYTIVNTLTEFETINKVQFWIEGNVVNELTNYPINNPFQRNTTIIGCIIDESESDEILALSEEILLVLKNKDIGSLENYIHPVEGLRFSPYVCANFEENHIFEKNDLLSAWNSSNIYNFGSYDGTGDPINLTFKDYYDRFVYERDYSTSNDITVNNDVLGYLLNPRLTALYPGFNITNHYMEGVNPDYGGLDWKSLKLVYQKYNGVWSLVSIIHDEWTT
jgi:spore germination protein GerM